MAAGILQVLDLNTNPSNFEGFGTPASFNRAWTERWCRAEGFATRPVCAKYFCENSVLGMRGNRGGNVGRNVAGV